MHCNSWKNIEGKDQCRQLAPSRHPHYCTQFAANNRILPSLLLGSKFKIPNSRFQLPPVDILFTIPTLNRSTPEIASKFHTLTYPEEKKSTATKQASMPGFDFSNYNRNAALHARGVPLPKATSTGTTIVGCIFDGGVVVSHFSISSPVPR